MSVTHPATQPAIEAIGAGPQPLSPAVSAPRSHALDRSVRLQCVSALPIPPSSPPASADDGLAACAWHFPEPLLAQARAGVAHPYDVVLTGRDGDGALQQDTVENVTWATLVSFRLRRLAENVPGYQLLGADGADRDLLLALWRHLAASGATGTVARLFVAQAADAGKVPCLAELAAAPSLSFLVKTRAMPFGPPSRADVWPLPAGPTARGLASLEDLTGWLRLLCEASVAGGGQGWHFIAKGSEGVDLPALALDVDGCATLTLLVIAGEQQASPLAAGRLLLPFNNVALIGGGGDVAAQALSVEAADDSDVVRIARVPPGSVGFSVMLPVSDTQTPQQQLQALFSKATRQLLAPPFEAPSAPIPAGTATCDGFGLDLRQRARADRLGRAGHVVASAPPPGRWRHDLLIPVAPFGPPSPAPAVLGLPDPADDPYRGVGSSVVMQLDFADPPWPSDAAQGPLHLPVGYTDPLIAVADWPGAGSGFTLQAAPGGAQLQINIAADPSLMQPQPGQTHDQFVGSARARAERYASIHFQLAQPQLSLSVLTSLQQDGNGEPSPLAVDSLASLRTFVAAAYVASRAAAALTASQQPGAVTLPADAAQLRVPYTLRAGDSLATVAARFRPAASSTNPAYDLAAANLAMPGTVAAGTITAAGIQVDARAGDSLGGVLGRLQTQSARITLADLVDAIGSTGGHLAEGGLLICPPARLPGAIPLTPMQAATAYGLDALSFAQANAGVAGLIAVGVLLPLGHPATTGRCITTRDLETFNSLVSRFAAHCPGIDLAELVARLKDCAFLKAGALALLPPAPAMLGATVGVGTKPFSSAAFRLTVALRLQRPVDAVDPAFRSDAGDGPVERAESSVAAADAAQGAGAGLSAQLRQCLPALRLATEGAAMAAPWIVDLGSSGIAQLRIAPDVTTPDGKARPRMFALRPLHADLVTLDSAFKSLQEDGSLSSAATAVTFSDVDLDVWARRFLADVDRFLSAPRVNCLCGNTAAQEALETVLAAKAGLCNSIAAGLAATLVVEDPQVEAGLTEARRVLAQALALQLSLAYGTPAVLQYDTTVASPWASPGQHGARLLGTAKAATGQADGLLAARVRLDASPSFATLLMTGEVACTDDHIRLDLAYQCSELELDIREEPDLDGSESSRRLGFCPPLSDALWPGSAQVALGSAEVPLPLRAVPLAPVLLGQSATPSFEAPATLDKASQWTYQFRYACEHAAHDEVYVEFTFNALQETATTFKSQTAAPALATALAGYMHVADALQARLDGQVDGSSDAKAATQARAAQSFASLVTDVADAWATHWEPDGEYVRGRAVPAGPPAQQRLCYRVQRTQDASTGTAQLVLTRLEKPEALDAWPDICVVQPDGTAIPLTANDAVGNERTYLLTVTSTAAAEAVPHFAFSWTGLSLPALESAQGAVWVQRNHKLLGAQGPDTQGSFLYRTPPANMPEPVVPLNRFKAPVDITALGSTVAEALAAAIGTLAPLQEGAAPRVARIAALCRYAVVAPTTPPSGIFATLPVLLSTERPLAANTANVLSDELDGWWRQNRPAAPSAQWVFNLVLYSSVTPELMPLLVLDMIYAFDA